MAYDWVVFDADETLFRFDAKRGLTQLLQSYDVDFTEAHFNRFKEVNAPLWEAFQRGEISAADIKSRRFVDWEDRLGVSSTELNRQFMAQMGTISSTLDGAGSMLAALDDKVRMGIITNGFVDLQQERLATHQFEQFFQFVVVSEALGVAKPHPEIFHHTHREHISEEVPTSRILMVGDNPYSDILGGQRAGWHTCWLNEHQATCPEQVKPNHTIRHLSELVELVA
ncbi:MULTISPECIES: pyrimidine 5'-nucleotidase [unclassified Idiomarina]|jgi:YjjG family noncanonical pyrimidine nucleotidase|uniref:pyrimidine 5'-nucleotidase n=1 Tax=unclassified Idiomarina TaxID=2614829 RepID=UPI000C8B3D38|nr:MULTISPECIES: pyrimidine 5'-nucleotidase [unclassified Idiomarina]MAD53199.1 noncanonical pyrimidine nucleotidase, YjjG family [Idiomarinaceae bacterium]NQZ04868.1 pyrimidine 5'-nucleotidase [Idiomarina sp.]|tara:strand:+ start:4604 stop:5281 length:678 start_codon:yes stop_codon:yes gene_type:complete